MTKINWLKIAVIETIGILLLVIFLCVMSPIDSHKYNVKCYDNHDNEIVGQVCEEVEDIYIFSDYFSEAVIFPFAFIIQFCIVLIMFYPVIEVIFR